MIKQEINQYWETVFNTIQDGIMIVDKGGTIVSVNRALENITGYPKKELVGKSCRALNCDICQTARDRRGEQWCALFRTGRLNMRKCSLMKKDGSYIHVLKNASLLLDGGGKTIGAVETLTDISEIVQRENQIEAFQHELKKEDGFHGILGFSNPMQNVFNLISNAARSEAPVIIYGESGTGKDLVAGAVHEIGPRKRRPFVKVNCAALNESLLESELFGHVKGAFTGAYRTRQGRFEAARGGDIFLDEIGDVPLSIQVKLLRVLEEKTIERVGENKPVMTDVRIITATNKNLRSLIDKGLFREDLFYRINVLPITLPPLRERKDDIPLLAEAFLKRIRMKSGKSIRGFSNAGLSALMSFPWPGNVRELKSALEYAAITCHDSLIQPHNLPPSIFRTLPGRPQEKKTRDEIKREQLITALKNAQGNRSRAARLLGVSRVTVWNRMKKLGVCVNNNIE